MTKAAVYRLFDADGDLLYVGCSINPKRRIARHRATQPWGRDIAAARTLIEWHPSLGEAAEAECEAIAAGAPLCNARMQRYGPTEESIRAQRRGGYAALAYREEDPRCSRYRCDERGVARDRRGWHVCERHAGEALGL